MGSPGVDVIVVSYRTPVDLGHFLDSFDRHSPTIPHSLTICNVDPFDEDRRIAERYAHGTYFEWDTNVGYATAVNYAASFGDKEVIGIFNADTRLMTGVIDGCYNSLLSKEDWGILGPLQTNDAGIVTAGGIFGTNEAPKDRGWGYRDAGRFGDVRDDAISVSGSAYFIKRTVWNELTNCPLYCGFAQEALGAFLPTRLFYEETYCSFHARFHGYKVVFDRRYPMKHNWHKSVKTGMGFVDREARTSHSIFREACDFHGIAHD